MVAILTNKKWESFNNNEVFSATISNFSIYVHYTYSSEFWSCYDFYKAASFPLISDKPASQLPDPFVKIILLPDRPRRRKTEFVKDSLHPVWEERFTFSVPAPQLREKSLELVVLDKKGLFVR